MRNHDEHNDNKFVDRFGGVFDIHRSRAEHGQDPRILGLPRKYHPAGCQHADCRDREYHNYYKERDTNDYGSHSLPRSKTYRCFRKKLIDDRTRPTYHLVNRKAPAMPGDPNGAIYYKNPFDLHYIVNDGGYSYAHVSSNDMVHWRWHPLILTPRFTGHGMFSGTCFLNKEGIPTIIYHGAGWAGTNWPSLPMTASIVGPRLILLSPKNLVKLSRQPDSPLGSGLLGGRRYLLRCFRRYARQRQAAHTHEVQGYSSKLGIPGSVYEQGYARCRQG